MDYTIIFGILSCILLISSLCCALERIPGEFRRIPGTQHLILEIPSGNDRFELEVSPPFGEEDIIVYSSLTSLGDINLQGRKGDWGGQATF